MKAADAAPQAVRAARQVERTDDAREVSIAEQWGATAARAWNVGPGPRPGLGRGYRYVTSSMSLIVTGSV